MAFCTNCGQEVAEGTKFCANCGTPIGVQTQKKDDIVTNSQPYTGPAYEDKSEKSSEKRMSPIIGIIALVLALIGFFGDPPILTVIVSIISIGLAIFSFIKKGKLKGFAIAAIVISALSLIITVATGGTNQPPENKDSSSNSSKTVTGDAKDTEYSVGGITFTVPAAYIFDGDDTLENKAGTIGVFFEDGGNGVSDEKFAEIADKLDDKVDEMASALLTDSVRKKALESTVAEFNSRSYTYVGQIDGKDAIGHFEFINDTKKESIVLVFIIGLQSEEETINNDFDSIIKSAKYTGASDTVAKESSNVTNSASDAPEGVDPDLVAFLDEYEQFMDEYIDFMSKYYANPTDLKLLGEYADILQEYEDFSEKVDAYDSDSMSTADASYYLEVTTRVTQKMLNVLGTMSE